MYSFVASFKGKTAHSGSNPWFGRSATDAVELMHAATERMREHVPTTARIHWVTLEGGEAPNVVPDRASTWYFVRDTDSNVEKDFHWVMDCAGAAALMTQTIHQVRVLTAIHQRHSSRALAELLFENIEAIGKVAYTEEEEAFARAVQKTEGLPEKGMDYPVKIVRPETAPYQGGSSDVGEVTLVAPCATLRFPARIAGDFPGHHWTVVTNGISSIAHKGITAGAKVACGTAYDLLVKPGALVQVRQEFTESSLKNPYRPFLPPDSEPPLGWNAGLMGKYRSEMEKFYIAPV